MSSIRKTATLEFGAVQKRVNRVDYLLQDNPLAAKICFDGVENGPSKIWVTNTLQQTLDLLPLLPGQIKIYDDVTVQLLGDRVETNLLSHAAVHQ